VSALGVVLLHGKWDTPPFAIAPLATALNDAGHTTRMATYPWALRRLYDQSLDAVFADLRAQVVSLRETGSRQIILCGHSLGAAVALAFAARQAPVDGLVILAPGHFPERIWQEGLTRDALVQAHAHRGMTHRIPLIDTFQGTARRLRIRPDHYLDYFDPDGPLVWPDNMRRIDACTPLLWVVGNEDPAAALGIDYAFTHKKSHPLDHYRCLPADHVGTPAAATAIVTDWLSRLESLV